MKTIGIIAEYNPFHNGHAYQIAEAKRLTGADYCIAAISGSFVQRGAPAITDKYTRARMALSQGADLILELPVTAALSSAEGFATGGVSLFEKIHVVDYLSFGQESMHPLMDRLAHLYVTEPAFYRTALGENLRQGLSYPAARLHATLQQFSDPEDKKTARELLSRPNNILAIEYRKAMERCHASYMACPVRRSGSAYHDTSVSAGTPASATAIRHALLQNSNPSSLQAAISKESLEVLTDHQDKNRLLTEDDFSDLLYFSIEEKKNHLSDYCNEDLALRIQRKLEDFDSWSSFTELIKTRNQTYTAISRCFAHILLDLKAEDFLHSASLCHAPYARILGFRKSAAPLLKNLREQSEIPVLSRLAKDQAQLSDEARTLLQKDLHATDVYNRIVYTKSGQRLLSDYRQPLICL